MMSIWFRDFTLDDLQNLTAGNMLEHLGIRYTDFGDDYLSGTMPVDSRTTQPAGLLHGGASMTLAESLGSMAANLCVDTETFYCVGQEINANHIRPVREGHVKGTARPIHLGKRTQVWEIRIENEAGQLVSIARLTMAAIAR